MVNQIKCLGISFLLLLLFYPAIAQEGKIVGTVINKETGGFIPGANVIIINTYQDGEPVELEYLQGAASNLDGYYTILNVTPGIYDIEASVIGYKTIRKSKVIVNMDLTTKVDFQLEPTVIEGEVVEVIAERPLIQPDISGTQEIINTQQVDATPVLRMDEFVNKIKGVELSSTNDGMGLSVRGGDIRETDVRIDGISLRDPRSENSYLSINSTSIEELQVMTGGFQAKYGHIRSGLVNAVTKEGRRDKYNLTCKFDMTPSPEKKFFGTNHWGKESPIYKVFAGEYAMQGVPDSVLGQEIPNEPLFTDFKGWESRSQRPKNLTAMGLPERIPMTPEQKRDLWLFQHPMYKFAEKPDYYFEGTLTGPLPGVRLPMIGNYFGKSTFLLGVKYEDAQFAFPLGARDNYTDWNAQLKITTRFSTGEKLSINGMYAKINTLTAGRPSTFGGALVDMSSRFNFLNATDASVRHQGQLLAGQTGLSQMYNQSRLQLYDRRHIIGEIKYTNNLSMHSFFTVKLEFNYADHTIQPFGFDPSDSTNWVSFDTSGLKVLNIPYAGAPNASTNYGRDITDNFNLYGGLQAVDSSYSWRTSLRCDYTVQVGKHHEFETGIDFLFNHIFVNSGTWQQAEKSWTPDTWQYFTETPIYLGLYLQDKLEFEGMVANIGLRADYFNPLKKSYEVKHPLDNDYKYFYDLIYTNLPGDFGSLDRWVKYREMLDQPKGWPTTKTKPQIKLSPRIGVSFPITIASKLYFNYGHFFQKPNIHFLYNRNISPGSAIVPSPELNMAKTVAFEFGYEQLFLQKYLLNASAYYKNVEDEPLSRTYIDYWETIYVTKYFPDAFRDIRGIELRMEKKFGRFFTFWGNYEYMLVSYGEIGKSRVFENRLKAAEETRYSSIYTTEPRPSAQLNLNWHTPPEFGPSILSCRPLSDIYMNLFYEWRDQGDVILNPEEPEEKQQRIGIVDYVNMDLRGSKRFTVKNTDIEFVVTVQNLLNIKRLTYSNMPQAQYYEYKESLKTEDIFAPEERDRLGEYPRDEYIWETATYKIRKSLYRLKRSIGMKAEKPWRWGNNDHIKIGWYDTPLYLNPRRVLIGIRVYF